MKLRIDKFKVLSWPLRKAAAIGFSAAAFLTFAISAQAIPNYVVNGGFESISNGSGGMGEFNNATYTSIANWTSSGYNFLFVSGTADTTGGTGTFGNLKLWGPNDGSANGLPASSPAGGNYVAADGNFEVGAISQMINGLTMGNRYSVGFWWAGAQQSGFNGPTTEQWQVSFGSQTQSTVVVNNANHGFTGWVHQTFTYTANNTSELLSFMAVGTPAGVPPFVLLDGVTVNDATPEPGSLALMFSGLGLIGLGVIRSKNWFRK
jgi:hypothetical protein